MEIWITSLTQLIYRYKSSQAKPSTTSAPATSYSTGHNARLQKRRKSPLQACRRYVLPQSIKTNGKRWLDAKLIRLGPESKTSEAVGIIREVATEPTQMTGRNVAASDEEPRYTVSYYFIQCVAGGANWGGKRLRMLVRISNRLSKSPISWALKSRIVAGRGWLDRRGRGERAMVCFWSMK